jgi:hypothetical protein
MFSEEIIGMDSFLDMGATARLLYYDLGMRADDDGFVSPRGVMRITGASEDDLRVLAAKGFVHTFEDGVIVILHWQRHNTVKNDRYIPSLYTPRLKKLGEKYAPRLRDPGSRLDPNKQTNKQKEISLLNPPIPKKNRWDGKSMPTPNMFSSTEEFFEADRLYQQALTQEV